MLNNHCILYNGDGERLRDGAVWTMAEKDWLRKWNHLGVGTLAGICGRSKDAIRTQRTRMKLRRCDLPTDQAVKEFAQIIGTEALNDYRKV